MESVLDGSGDRPCPRVPGRGGDPRPLSRTRRREILCRAWATSGDVVGFLSGGPDQSSAVVGATARAPQDWPGLARTSLAWTSLARAPQDWPGPQLLPESSNIWKISASN